MSVVLNHTIVKARDKQATARFLVEILGLSEPTTYGPFVVVQMDNEVSLDIADDHGDPHPQHYAFLVGDSEFDEIHGRIVQRGLPFWADPFHRLPEQVNTDDGGRGLYWDDPDGHSLRSSPCPTEAEPWT